MARGAAVNGKVDTRDEIDRDQREVTLGYDIDSGGLVGKISAKVTVPFEAIP
jgi:hypothetical protein